MAESSNREREIFLQALDLSSPDARVAYIAQACGSDEVLRRQVEAMLQAHATPDSFLEKPAAAWDVTLDSSGNPDGMPARERRPIAGPGTRIGVYKLVQQIGEGGMGVVFMAEQQEPVRRMVALKIIKPGMDSAQVLARFEAERQALALMDHPNIARVLDAGATVEGRPFFVMELVKGVPINKFCDERRLTPRQRLELFIPICQAIQHAHQKGIIHRDLKPSNVMIALYDGNPVPKVIDFGVAKATGQKLTEKTLYTAFGAMAGTLEYMSPEQAELNQLDIDTRIDIYSLGVLLYELLTGSTPLDHKRLKAGAFLETLRMIREEEPPKPSARLSAAATLPTLSAQRQTEPAHLSKLMRGELDWIVMKALEKQRERRYETATGLARDIERYLRDEPVQAGPPSPTYRLRKYVKRHKGPALAAAMVFMTLMAGIVATSWYLVKVREARNAALHEWEIAQAAKRDADKHRAVAEEQTEMAERERQRAQDAGDQKAKQLALAQGLVYDLQFQEAYHHFQSHDLVRCRLVLDECRPDLRGPEYGYLMRQIKQKERTLQGPRGPLALSDDGKRLTSASADGDIKVWDVETGTEISVLRGAASGNLLALSGDGKRAASASINDTTKAWTTKVWDVEAGKEIRTLPGAGGICMAFSRDGKHLATPSGKNDNTVTVWDLDADKPPLTFTTPETRGWISCLALSDDSKWLFAGRDATEIQGVGFITMWNLETGKLIRTLRSHTLDLRTLVVSADDKRLVSGSYQFIEVWDLETGNQIHTLRGHNNLVGCLAFSADGKQLLSGSHDSTIKLWDVETGMEILTLRGHKGGINSLALSRSGNRLVSAGEVVKVWDLEGGREARTLPASIGRVVSVALSGDGKRLFFGRGLDVKLTDDGRRTFLPADGVVNALDLETGKETPALTGLTGDVRSLALSADGKRLFAGSAYNLLTPGNADDTIKAWDLQSGKETLTLRGHTGAVLNLIPTSDGKRLVSSSGDGTIKVWDLETQKATFTLPSQAFGGVDEGQYLPLALSNDGKRLFSGGTEKVTIWDLETGTAIRTLPGHTTGVLSLAISNDGKRLVSGSWDRVIKVWDLETGKDIFTLRGDVGGLVLSPNGKRLFSGGDNSIKLWDLKTGKELLNLPGHVYGVTSLVLSEGGKRLVSVGRDGGVKIWEFGTGE